MKYVSLDLETTCLIPHQDHVLMISAIIEDTNDIKPLHQLPHFTCFVDSGKIVYGSHYALAMNHWILDIISGRAKGEYPIYDSNIVWNQLIIFLKSYFGEDKITLAGKNVAAFDYQFLPHNIRKMFRHRMIDVGSVFIDWNRNKVMSLEELLKVEIPYYNKEVSHSAYEDALDVIRLLRKEYVYKEE